MTFDRFDARYKLMHKLQGQDCVSFWIDGFGKQRSGYCTRFSAATKHVADNLNSICFFFMSLIGEEPQLCLIQRQPIYEGKICVIKY